MEIVLCDLPKSNVIAHGSYDGGPDYDFIVGSDGQVYFQVVGNSEKVWAGPNAESFRRIVAAWNQYRVEVTCRSDKAAQLECVNVVRQRLAQLGAFPRHLPPDPEPLWSLLVFEAEHGLG